MSWYSKGEGVWTLARSYSVFERNQRRVTEWEYQGVVLKEGPRFYFGISNRAVGKSALKWKRLGWAKSLRHAKARVAFLCGFNAHKDMVFE